MVKKKRRWRPLDEPQFLSVSAYLSDAEVVALGDLAAEMGLSVGQLVRKLIMDGCGHQLAAIMANPDFLPRHVQRFAGRRMSGGNTTEEP